jgi:hypothetical protein
VSPQDAQHDGSHKRNRNQEYRTWTDLFGRRNSGISDTDRLHLLNNWDNWSGTDAGSLFVIGATRLASASVTPILTISVWRSLTFSEVLA